MPKLKDNCKHKFYSKTVLTCCICGFQDFDSSPDKTYQDGLVEGYKNCLEALKLEKSNTLGKVTQQP